MKLRHIAVVVCASAICAPVFAQADGAAVSKSGANERHSSGAPTPMQDDITNRATASPSGAAAAGSSGVTAGAAANGATAGTARNGANGRGRANAGAGIGLGVGGTSVGTDVGIGLGAGAAGLENGGTAR